LSGEEFPLYGGCKEHLRSFTYISDIVDGCEAVVNDPGRCVGEIFNIGGAKEITTWEAVGVVEDIIGRKARFVPRPPRLGDQLRTCADIEKARRILGYEPRVSLREGLKAEVCWYMQDVLPHLKEHSGLL
jgi:UDP-glucuronate 4-epimerase